MVWSHPGEQLVQEQRGVVVTTSPWRLVDYWGWTREPDLADYQPMAGEAAGNGLSE